MDKPTETDVLLVKLIRVGDGIETRTGIYPARTPVSERFGVGYYHAIVNVQMEQFGVPVHTDAINAVWRNGQCLWRRGESMVQKPLFGEVAYG